MEYKLYNNDLPSSLKFNKVVAIDTETMGLKLHRDRLCLVQISNGDGIAHLIQIKKNIITKPKNLITLLKDSKITKLFHFARFDLSVLNKNIVLWRVQFFVLKLHQNFVELLELNTA